jgi:hypothetical protein
MALATCALPLTGQVAACGELASIDLMADAENGWPLAVMCPRWASSAEIWRSDLRGGLLAIWPCQRDHLGLCLGVAPWEPP